MKRILIFLGIASNLFSAEFDLKANATLENGIMYLLRNNLIEFLGNSRSLSHLNEMLSFAREAFDQNFKGQVDRNILEIISYFLQNRIQNPKLTCAQEYLNPEHKYLYDILYMVREEKLQLLKNLLGDIYTKFEASITQEKDIKEALWQREIRNFRAQQPTVNAHDPADMIQYTQEELDIFNQEGADLVQIDVQAFVGNQRARRIDLVEQALQAELVDELTENDNDNE